MPYEPIPVLNTIPFATYNDGTTFPIVKINYPFEFHFEGNELIYDQRNPSAVAPYVSYPAELDLNMWLLYLQGPFGFCSWKQLAWHSGNSIIFNIGRSGDFIHMNEHGGSVVDWSWSPVGDCDLPVYGFVKLFVPDSASPVHKGDLQTKFSFGNEIWKIPLPEIMGAIGDTDSVSSSFSGIKSIITVPAVGAKTLDAKTISQVLEFRGNPEQVFRTKEELRRMTYGNGSIGSLWVGEKIFPGRFNSLREYTRVRDLLKDSNYKYWATTDYDQDFGKNVVFWRKLFTDQIRNFNGGMLDSVYNSQGILMSQAVPDLGDSLNRWPLVTRVDSSVYDSRFHTTNKAKTGELATSPFDNAISQQIPAVVATPTLMYTPMGDHEAGFMSTSIAKLVALNGELELKYHAPLQAGKSPWYDKYDDFQNDIRPLSKGYSVLPEFRVSTYVEDGIDATNKDELELVGTSQSLTSFSWDTLSDAFSTAQLLSSELITIKRFSEEAGSAKKRKIRFDFEAIKKFHPYTGFFPADRSVQIGNLLYKGYYDSVYGITETGLIPDSQQNSLHWQSFLYHLMAPGMFYNSIKSAIGVGLPAFASSSMSLSFPVYGYHHDANYIPKCIMSNPKFYLPFETMFNIPRNIVPVQNSELYTVKRDWGSILFAPYIWEMFPGDEYYHDLNCFLTSGNFKPLFELANHNFFAESANLFLKDGLTAFYSKPESQFKAMVGGSVYYMDVVLRNKNCVVCEGASKEVTNIPANYTEAFVPAVAPGLEDATFSGSFILGVYKVSVRISNDATDPEEFQFSVNDGAYSAPAVGITPGVAQAITGSGISVTFAAKTGHTTGDVWHYFSNGELNLSQKGSVFGFPVSLSSSMAYETTNDAQEVQRNLDIRDPAYGPFTPPYFYAPAVARISFDPQEADPNLATGQSKKFTLDEILKHAEIRTYSKTNTGGQIISGANTYYAYPGADDEINALNGFYHEFDWRTALYHHEDDVYSFGAAVSSILGSTLLQTGFMSIAQSVDLFNKKLVTPMSFAGFSGSDAFVGVQKNVGADKEYAWCINTKWESPVLQFNKHSTSTYDNMGSSAVEWPNRARGMWMDYGEEPAAGDGLFLEIRESFPTRKTQNRSNKNFFEILDPADVKGAAYSAMKTAMEEELYDLYDEVGAAYIPKKKIESLIDVCGFGVGEKKLGVVKNETEVKEAIVVLPFYKVDGEVKFFEIDKDMLALQLSNKQKFGYAYKTVYGDELKDTSITQLVEKMDQFVVPPWLDFTKNDVTPVAMYICDFGITLEKSDLLDIWQNFAPDKFYDSETEKKSVEHGWDTYELLHGQELPANTQFAVFKVKQRAEWNYDAVKPNHNKDEEFVFEVLNKQGTWESKRVDYNFNWPYDFCSLVEFGKVSCSFEFVGE